MLNLVLVATGAAIGAPLRYLLDHAVQRRHDGPFPMGILAVNILGCAVLGFLVAIPTPPAISAMTQSGFCGTLTTYSTFGHQTLNLARSGRRGHAILNSLLNIAIGLVAAFAGMAVAYAVTG